jgi:hypothetical protein
MIRVELHEIFAMVFGSGAVGVLSKLMFDLIRTRVNGKESPREGANISLPVFEDTEEYVTRGDCDRGMKAVTDVLGAKMGETHSLLKDLKSMTEKGLDHMSKKIDTIGEKVTKHEIEIQVLKRTG